MFAILIILFLFQGLSDFSTNGAPTAEQRLPNADSNDNNNGQRIYTEVGTHHKLVKCRHGTFLINVRDTYVGRSLEAYGEWSEGELNIFSQFITLGDTVLDVGANIGAFTIPLANMVGVSGVVHAFEPQRILSQLLTANVALNELRNVVVHNAAVGDSGNYNKRNQNTPHPDSADVIYVPKIIYSSEANFGALSLLDDWSEADVEAVKKITLDDTFYIKGNICPTFIKIDVEGMEQDVLSGAKKLVSECRPTLFLENNCVKGSKELINSLLSIQDLDGERIYDCYWHADTYHNSDNFGKVEKEILQGYSINMVCVSRDKDSSGISGLSNSTKLDGNRFTLKEYGLSFEGYSNIILSQLGTMDECQR
mmetsp:Transcript_48370/g.58352  ORF Transcript_48370/g.58352 Transcript_48370/m.58352 type:complete len:366 (+) Transcript_48370:73-1170(+)